MHRVVRSAFSVLMLTVLLVGAPIGTLRAQTPPITLSIAVDSWVKDQFFDVDGGQLMKDFESAHPGVKVNVIASNGFYSSPVYSKTPDEYFTGLEKYADTADVLSVASFATYPEAVQGGYFLDLTPYIAADKNFDAADFYPAALQSFQFDNGQWALPNTSGLLMMVNYDAAAFDAAGLTYPTDKWALDDFANAARKLVQRDAAGKVVRYGFDVTYEGHFLRSLLAQGTYDTTTSPNQPALDRPDVVELAKKWAALHKEGIIGPSYETGGMITLNAPLNVEMPFQTDGVQKNMTPALLPGARAGLNPQGFAVSGGSHYPELAYELVEFLTTRPNYGMGSQFYPARKSVTERFLAQIKAQGGALYNDQQRAIYENALTHAIPFSELRYIDYVSRVVYDASQDSTIDIEQALQKAQAQALKFLQMAEDKRKTVVLNVANPEAPHLAAGQVALKFGIGTSDSSAPNLDTWNALAGSFTTGDPQVKHIAFEGTVDAALDNLGKKYDCFYLPQSPVGRAQPGQLLALDPFLDVDKAFNRTDLLPGVLTFVGADNKLWGYPLTIRPLLLRYDSKQFAQNGIAVPDAGWQIDAFADALKTLHTASGGAVLTNGVSNVGGMPLLLLIAAYGGIPIDYRTSPPTIAFSDPANAAAIKQVLDLVKQGDIAYKALGNSDFTSAPVSDAAIFAEYLDEHQVSAPASTNKLIGFPTGSRYTPLAFDVGAAFISANTPNADGCYRWIASLAAYPELFDGLPARPAAADDPAWATLHGTKVTTFYKQYAAQLKAPNAIPFPSVFSTPFGGFILERWLYRAFDAYVLKNADLTTALADAQTYGSAFLTCLGSDNTLGDAYYQRFDSCMTKADPTINVQPGK